MSVALPPAVAGLEPTLPSSWYTSAQVFALEKERIFCREWLCVARAEELAEPGAFRVLEVLGESILLVRNREGQLRAFYNVCRHRGSRLCREPPAAGTPPQCSAAASPAAASPAPTTSGPTTSTAASSARPISPASPASTSRSSACTRWAWSAGAASCSCTSRPAQAAPLAAQLGAIPERVARYPLGELRIGHTIRYEVAANWKVICENYNECYHCAGVHPELCAVVPAFRERGGASLDWARGIPHRPGAYTFTSSGTTPRRAFPGLNEDEQVRHKGELVYPNLFLSLACDHAAVFVLQPRSATRTDIACHFLFEPFEIAKPGFRSARRHRVLGPGEPPGLGDLRERAAGHQRARARARLLRAHGRLQSRHPSLRPGAHRRRARGCVTHALAPPLIRPAPQRLRVRRKIYLFLFAFGFIAYLQHASITVAGVPMMAQLGLNEVQLAWIFDAFVLGYSIMQFPGGLLGQRFGARLTFVVIGLVAFVAMLATPLAPELFSGATLFAVLLVAQLILGLAQGPIFPVSAGVFEAWFRPVRWPLVQGVQSMGLQLGAAVAPLLLPSLMAAFGWQQALVWTTLPALGVILWWGWYARNTPAEHPRVSAEELAELGPSAAAGAPQPMSLGAGLAAAQGSATCCS